MGDYLDIVLFVGFTFNKTLIYHKHAAPVKEMKSSKLFSKKEVQNSQRGL